MIRNRRFRHQFSVSRDVISPYRNSVYDSKLRANRVTTVMKLQKLELPLFTDYTLSNLQASGVPLTSVNSQVIDRPSSQFLDTLDSKLDSSNNK
jgi:hypothetical protein